MTADISPINSRSRTVKYFETDSGIAVGGSAQYYAGRDFEHTAASRWYGRGARMLGLSGPVDRDDFKAILSGKWPDKGIELGRRVESAETGRTRREHRPGDDLTFKAPKSVSIAALKYGEAEAADAHDEAVRRVMRRLEARCITTRRNQKRVNTGNMVAAMFTHDTSRNHDPHLHTHVILANMTRRDDGKWMSIDRGSVSLEMRLIEADYHNELARILMEKGYRLRPVQYGEKRVFEIEGYTKPMIDAYSTRRRDMLDDMEKRGIRYSARAAQKAAIRTRKAKVEIDRAELRRRWDETAERLGFGNPCTRLDRWRNRKEARRLKAGGIDDPTGRDPEADLFRAIRRSLEHLGYHTPVIGDIALKSVVMNQLAGRVTLERIEGALEQMAEEGHLVKTGKPGSRTAWVTRESLAAEMGVIRTMAEGQGEARAIRPGFDAAAEIAGRGLTEGQSAAIEAILTGTDRITGVQGYAGTGKTTMLRTVVEMAGGRKFIGLAPTVGASVLLGAEAGMPSDTLQKFLVQHGDLAKADGGKADGSKLEALRKEYADTVVVVDEASMIGTKQMERLFRITERLCVERLVLVGDTKQLKSVEAGQPFKLMQQQGMATAVMEDIVRQRNDGLKIPVEMMLAGMPSRAIERLGDEGNAHGRLVEVDREELHRSVAGLYLNLSDEQRRGTIVMAQTNHDRRDINARIREGLLAEGTLGDHEYNGHRLVNRHLTPVEKSDALNYEPGDMLVFHSRYRSDNGDDHYEVKEVGADGRLQIESAGGHRREFDPAKGDMKYRYEVFEVEEIAFRTGDLVRFTRNDPDLREQGVINGAEATVERIDDDAVTLRLAGDDPDGDDAVVELARDHNALMHIDHGYCRTTYSAQGRTSERVIALADTGLEHLADQQNFYVQISRASEEAVVVTDDIEGLSENLERHTGERLSAMEAVGMTGPDNEPGMDGDIEMPELGRDSGIRMPGIVMPDQLPQEVRDIMDQLGGDAVHPAVMERAGESVAGEVRDHPQEMAQGITPGIEAKRMGPDGESPPSVAEPEAEPVIGPEQPRAVDRDTGPVSAPADARKQESPVHEVDRHGRGEATDEPAVETGKMEIEELAPEVEARRVGEIVADVIEVGERRMDGMVADVWLKLHEKDRETAPGIMAEPDRQENIARMIREGLEGKREIHGPGVEVSRLVQLPLSLEEKRDGGKFQIDDLLVFDRDIPEAGIRANERVPVVGIEQRGNRLEVAVRGRTEDGRLKDSVLEEGMASRCTAYRRMPMELKAGDSIRWKSAQERHGIAANHPVEVTRVNGRDIHIRTGDGHETVLDRHSSVFRSCDYSFNLSAWDIRNGTVGNAIAVASTTKAAPGVVNVVGQELMRRKENVVVFTDSFKRLNRQLGELGHKSVVNSRGIKGFVIQKVVKEIKKVKAQRRNIGR